ncbi:MAG: 3-phosphoglycerate dehydrogenase [Prolixibacteraceae bacterium]|nr:3-phosphoglycerate dehydrogenase [Prolixibacteraceae bacterium]MBN2775267.1 3-phosphoglycerate dehydrogenase [Prolixibacteraceae bacterium]
MRKILVATQKPFASEATTKISKIFEKAGYNLIILEKYQEKSDLITAVESVEAIIVRSDIIDAEVLEVARNLKIVVRAGAGYDNIDCKTAAEKDIVVMNTPGQNSNAVAELAIGLMVYISRGCFNGKSGNELKGKKLGIHAYGYVGRIVAAIAKGFGMNVFAFDPFINAVIIENDGVKACKTAEELYSSCNYISLHIPANEKTKESINYNLLSRMPENSILINTARKEVICEKSLLRILLERPDFKYVSDIEPDCKNEIIEKCEGQYFFTPNKMGAQTAEANINAGIAAAEQIVNFFENNDITFKVN